MYCAALRRASSRPAGGFRVLSQRSSQALQVPRSAPRRFASTSPGDKSRSWKGTLFRYGLAGGVVYSYFTSPIFADEGLFESPNENFSRTAPSSFHEASDESTQQPLPTVQSIVEERKLAAESNKKPDRSDDKTATDTDDDSSEEDAEGDAGQQAAFNPETGEINWDCPCLGGMAHGPCGQEFKAAFSCFVYSTVEPKGMECIDKFQGMQDCFREHPDVYGTELDEIDIVEQPETASDADESAVRGGQTTTTTTTMTPDEAHQSTTTIEKSRTATKDQTADEKKQDRPDNEPSRKVAAPSSPSSAATSEQSDKKEKKETEPKAATSEKSDKKKKETEPKAAIVESQTSLTTPTSTSAPPGPKWEDATGANVESQAKPAR